MKYRIGCSRHTKRGSVATPASARSARRSTAPRQGERYSSDGDGEIRGLSVASLFRSPLDWSKWGPFEPYVEAKQKCRFWVRGRDCGGGPPNGVVDVVSKNRGGKKPKGAKRHPSEP